MQDLAQNENAGCLFQTAGKKNAVKGTTIKFFSFFYDLSLSYCCGLYFLFNVTLNKEK